MIPEAFIRCCVFRMRAVNYSIRPGTDAFLHLAGTPLIRCYRFDGRGVGDVLLNTVKTLLGLMSLAVRNAQSVMFLVGMGLEELVLRESWIDTASLLSRLTGLRSLSLESCRCPTALDFRY